MGQNLTGSAYGSDFGLDVAKGSIPGVSFRNKFGRNLATVTGDAIWSTSTAYVEPVTAQVCNVKSDNVNDTSAGTGARTITITGINELYNVVTETVTLNGTTNVLTTNRYFNIHRAYVLTAATDSGSLGNITITSTAVGTPIISTLLLGYNQTQSSIYMVPAGYTAYVNNIVVFAQNITASAVIDIGFFVKDFGGVFRIQSDFLFQQGGNMDAVTSYSSPLKFDAKSTIMLKCISASSSSDIKADYDIWLIAN